MIISYYKDRFVEEGETVVPLEERAFNFGDGVYEVVRFYGGKGFGLREHLERLARSAAAIRIELPYTLDVLGDLISTAVEKTGERDVDVYFQISRGEAPRLHPFPGTASCLAMVAKPARRVKEEQRNKGIATITHPDERWANCHIKSLNLLPNVLAKQAAFDAGASESILIRDGVVTEGSSSNVFTVCQGTLYTAPADRRILNGITRRVVLGLANDLGIPVREESLAEAVLSNEAEELFVTSTTMEIMPVSSLNGKPLPTAGMGPITEKLMQGFVSKIGSEK